MSPADPTQVSPGKLEDVRELLNTWFVPNDTREERDELDTWLVADDVPRAQWSEVRRLRDEIRVVVEDPGQLDPFVNEWIQRYQIVPVVAAGEIRFVSTGTASGELAATVLEAVSDGTVSRLKACPDCRWVFFDNTRNGSKKWCMMNAVGPESRGCGNIAKARRHRARLRSVG